MKTFMGAIFAAIALVVASQGLAQHRLIPTVQTTIVPCPTASALLTIPEIASTNHRLRATLTLTDGARTLWDSGSSRCASLPMRYFTGHSGLQPGPDDPAFASGDALPGPTFRARVGDWVEIAFFNHVNPLDFPNTLDQGDPEMSGMSPSSSPDPTAGCDITYSGGLKPPSPGPGNPSPLPTSASLSTDTFPNCLHGSSTSNVHFHGTHTTPGTTGDNVLLFVRPANRINGGFQPSEQTADAAFATFFAQCEKQGYPAVWQQMPRAWREAQYAAIDWYDRNAPYKGKPKALPTPMWLWPVNAREIAHGLWPQYQVGATPYCYPLPEYVPGGRFHMGQSPGTDWYHAHKHGSTALNVANGMTGAFIIEGQYDDDLRGFYKSNPAWEFRDRVLVIQQLTPALNRTVPGGGPGSRAQPVLSVNGRRSPVVTMRPNQVELFRFINGAERDAALFEYFRPQGSTTPCSRPSTAPCVHWNQTAQDGVQFVNANYDPGNSTGSGYQGAAQDRQFYLAPANRADLLVQAPAAPGTYELVVQAGVCRADPAKNPVTGCPKPHQEVLLVVTVAGDAVTPGMPFVPVQSFPQLPAFLSDIAPSDVYNHRNLVFHDNGGTLQINNKQFADGLINQTMLLNSTEEWKISNLDNDKEHPFHIHINPFQIVEVFQPQGSDAQKGGACYANPVDPATWRPCSVPQGNFVWWDTFAIPGARQDTIACGTAPMTVAQCPQALREKAPGAVDCSAKTTCTVTIPGYFKMRTRFMDFPGQYVLHCHILTHEDRGMMELVEVVPDTTIYTHH